MERVTVYVDGFNFYYGLKRIKAVDSDWKQFTMRDHAPFCPVCEAAVRRMIDYLTDR